MTARLGAALSLLGLAAFASGCETTGGVGLTSQYVNTADGYFYKYGNFCGAGWPNYPEGATPQQNIAMIDGIEPVDDIDRVCRAHDRCYFEYGADNSECDKMLAELLRDHSMGATLLATGSSFLNNEFNAQCGNLAGEILTAVGQFKQGDYIASLAQDETARQNALGLMGLNALRNVTAGFPKTPGLCFFNDNQRAQAMSPAEAALYAAASIASAQGVNLTSFEPFFPADESSLAAGRAALLALQAAADSDSGAQPEGASALDGQ
jgi:hypothetical protein